MQLRENNISETKQLNISWNNLNSVLKGIFRFMLNKNMFGKFQKKYVNAQFA